MEQEKMFWSGQDRACAMSPLCGDECLVVDFLNYFLALGGSADALQCQLGTTAVRREGNKCRKRREVLACGAAVILLYNAGLQNIAQHYIICHTLTKTVIVKRLVKL